MVSSSGRNEPISQMDSAKASYNKWQCRLQEQRRRNLVGLVSPLPRDVDVASQ